MQERHWRQNMLLKSSLDLYRESKSSPGTKAYLYGNHRGDALLALARANMLPTRKYSDPEGNSACPRCGVYEETALHIIFECNDAHFTQDDFLKALGLPEEMQDPSMVNQTKRILLNWEKETNRSAQVPDTKG